MDLDWRAAKTTDRLSAATVAPLYFDVATPEQARAVARTVQARLLAAHGLLTTPIVTGQQWDAPNGWAPLQWMAIDGLARHGETALAEDIAKRWIAQNLEVFRATGKLVEKYDVTSAAEGGGGEYPLQDGFGWTNGVLRRLLALYPNLAPPKPASKSRKERAHGLAALSIPSSACGGGQGGGEQGTRLACVDGSVGASRL